MSQRTINKKIHDNFKNVFKNIDTTTIIKMIFWIIFLVTLICFTILFITEKTGFDNYKINDTTVTWFNGRSIGWIKTNINNGHITSGGYNDGSQIESDGNLINAYIVMYNAAGQHYQLINFSLMNFITSTFAGPATDPTTAWTTRSNAIDLAYSYMFITALISIISLITQIYISGKMIIENRRIKKLNLSTKFPTSSINFSLFKSKMYSDFITNLAIVFAFFNFLSTLIVIGYWCFIYIVTTLVKKFSKKQLIADNTLSQHKSDLMYLIFVMVFQNIYTIIKAIFLSKWGVNLDLIFSIILPIGTITVIVGIFIKNMLSSKVNSVLTSIKGVEGTISTFRTFFYTNRIEALDDFNFVAILPPMIKAPLTSGNINKEKAEELMEQLDDAIKFIEVHYAKKTKDKQFMLYNLMNNITTSEQIQEMKDNTIKIEQSSK